MIKKTIDNILNNLLTYFVSGLLTGGVIAHEYTQHQLSSQFNWELEYCTLHNNQLVEQYSNIVAENDSLRRVVHLQELGLLK